MLYLDSAIIAEAQQIVTWGWVKGITTNPTILAKSNLPPGETLSKLASLSPGELYYQLTSRDFESMVAEGKKAREIIGEKTVLKIPATTLGFQVAAHLSSEITCAITAIYSPAQAAVAQEAGVKYAIAYVNRATRLLGDGIGLVEEMAEILSGVRLHSPHKVEILAASIKSPEEAAAALQAGADHLTLPLNILAAMTTQEFSEQTVEEFAQKGCGLSLTAG